ncbi:ribosomal protein L7/L12 [Mumia sp. DW29H23]|uniref:ribosomal protein L7/L12 n=1 Tax=Mumia sp. DW29H23 TaxID=3421241 RepID=UPI003D68F39A
MGDVGRTTCRAQVRRALPRILCLAALTWLVIAADSSWVLGAASVLLVVSALDAVAGGWWTFVRTGERPRPAIAARYAEPGEYDVHLTDVGPHEIQVIKAVRETTALGLADARAIVSATPGRVVRGRSERSACAVAQTFNAAGASALVTPTRDSP